MLSVCTRLAEEPASFHTVDSGQFPSTSVSITTKAYLRFQMGARAVRMWLEWAPVLPRLWASKTSLSGEQIFSSYSPLSFMLVVDSGL